MGFDLAAEAFLERLARASDSASGFWVSGSFFLPCAATDLSPIQSEYCLNSLIFVIFLFDFCAVFYSGYFFVLPSAFVFLSSLLMKKSILCWFPSGAFLLPLGATTFLTT